MPEKTQVLRIKRQESPNSEPYYEEFEIPFLGNHNIISMLMEIRRNPVTRQGKRVAPVVFDANFMKTTMAAWSSDGPRFSWEPVDVSLIKPRPRRYDVEKSATETKAA